MPRHWDTQRRLIELLGDDGMKGLYFMWDLEKNFYGFCWAATPADPLDVTWQADLARKLCVFGFCVRAVEEGRVTSDLQIEAPEPYRLQRMYDPYHTESLARQHLALQIEVGHTYSELCELAISDEQHSFSRPGRYSIEGQTCVCDRTCLVKGHMDLVLP